MYLTSGARLSGADVACFFAENPPAQPVLVRAPSLSRTAAAAVAVRVVLRSRVRVIPEPHGRRLCAGRLAQPRARRRRPTRRIHCCRRLPPSPAPSSPATAAYLRRPSSPAPARPSVAGPSAPASASPAARLPLLAHGASPSPGIARRSSPTPAAPPRRPKASPTPPWCPPDPPRPPLPRPPVLRRRRSP